MKQFKLKEIFEIKTGNSKYTKDYIKKNEGIYPVYSGQTSNNGIFGNINTYDLKGEYITITKDGYAGKVFYRNQNFSCTSHTFYLKQKVCDKNLINLKYIFWLLKKKEKKLKIFSIIGSVIPSITKLKISNFKINVISFKEQQKIIDIIEPIEKQIKIINILIEKLTLFIKDFINKSLLDPTNITYKLKEIFEIKTGNSKYTKDYIDKNKGIYPVYSSQVSNKGIIGKMNTYIYDGEYITMTKDGTCGVIFYRNEKFSVSNSFVFNLNKDFEKKTNIKFMFWLMKKNEKRFKTIEMGSVVKHIYKRNFRNFKFNLPEFKNQQKIIVFLKLYEKLKILKKQFKKIKNNLIKLII